MDDINEKEIKIALQRAMRYCAFQERCQTETRQRLAEWGYYGDYAEGVIAELIQNNFINEERYARQFAGGKFRLKKWGRLKIERELKFRDISEYCIRKAMDEIEEEEYLDTLKKLLMSKFRQIKVDNTFIKKDKVSKFAISKGYEPNLIWEILRSSEWDREADPSN